MSLERTKNLLKIGAGTFVLVSLGLLGATNHPLVSTIWPAAGFALAAFLTRGRELALTIAIVAAIANWMHAAPLPSAVVLGGANALGPLVAVTILRRLDFNPQFSSLRDGLLFIAYGGLLGPLVSASIGVAGLRLISETDAGVATWLTWWTGDAVGVLAFGPWFLLFLRNPVRPSFSVTLRGVAVASLVIAATVVPIIVSTRLSWVLFIVVGWRAVKDGMIGAAAAIVVSAIVGTAVLLLADTSESLGLAQALEFNQSLLLGLSVAGLLFSSFWQQHLEALARQQRLERLRTIGEQLTGSGSWEWETHTGRLGWSDGLLEIFGLERRAFSGQVEDFTDRLHPDDKAAVMDTLQSALDRGEGFSFEERIVRGSDGEIRTLESFGRVQCDADGHAVLVGTCLDVTERRQQEVQLRRTLAHLRAVIDSSPLATLELSRDARVLAWNASAERLFGWRSDEIVGVRNPLVPPDGWPTYAEALEKAFGGETVVIGAQRRISKSGADLIARVSLAPVHTGHDVVESVIAILEDVTARERLEAELRRSEADLLDLIDSAPVGIYRKTLDGELLMANRALANLLGYSSPEDLCATSRRQVLYHDTAERERLFSAFARGAQSLASVVALRRKDGSSVRVQWDARAVRDAEGKVIYHECFVRDLTARLNAEHALRESRDKLSELSRRVIVAQEAERQSIARGLHDEIGQTLTAIRLSLTALQTRLGSDSPAPELEDSLAMLDLASRSVLELSVDLRPSVLDDIGLEAALHWYLHRSASRAQIDVTFQSTLGGTRLDSSVEVCCYRIAQEAMTNVLRHASARHVEVTLHCQDGNLVFALKDDGTGFDVHAMSKAPHEARLGLLGMAERAALLAGTVDLLSGPGGTQMLLTLPLTSTARSEDAAKSAR